MANLLVLRPSSRFIKLLGGQPLYQTLDRLAGIDNSKGRLATSRLELPRTHSLTAYWWYTYFRSLPVFTSEFCCLELCVLVCRIYLQWPNWSTLLRWRRLRWVPSVCFRWLWLAWWTIFSFPLHCQSIFSWVHPTKIKVSRWHFPHFAIFSRLQLFWLRTILSKFFLIFPAFNHFLDFFVYRAWSLSLLVYLKQF